MLPWQPNHKTITNCAKMDIFYLFHTAVSFFQKLSGFKHEVNFYS